MLTLLARLFIPDRSDSKNPKVRQAYGMLCGLLGIALNLILFAGKAIAGSMSGSIAITADAFNNLSDAGSSLITLIGFKMAGQKPDPSHPFGHGRIEYITGLIVSALILIMGFELATSSIDSILHPQPTDFSILSCVILLCSIVVKAYMAFYNRRTAAKIESAAMKATATDSLSDMAATAVVLVSLLIGHFTSLRVDGWCGLLVSLFILYAGFSSAKETINPLLGQAPDPAMIRRVQEIVMRPAIITGMHDLVIHDYGPGRQMVSLHAEVPVHVDILKAHDVIDNVEKELKEKLGCDAVIHMDPIATDDPATNRLKDAVMELGQAISPQLSIHDFRVVSGDTHTNVIFDAVVPFSLDAERVKQQLEAGIEALPGGHYYAVIQIDRPYNA